MFMLATLHCQVRCKATQLVSERRREGGTGKSGNGENCVYIGVGRPKLGNEPNITGL